MPDGTSRFSLQGTSVYHYMGCSTFANFTVLPEIALAKIREDAPFDKVCYIGCGVTTGIGAVINTAKVEPGANVVVFGLGGIGLNVVQGARLRNVLASKSDDSAQLDFPIEPRGQAPRIGDGLARPDDGRGRLRKVNRCWRWRAAGLGGVGRIVLTKTKHVLARPRNWRVPADAIWRIRQAGLRILRQVVAIEFGHESVAKLGGVAPRCRPGVEKAQHVRWET